MAVAMYLTRACAILVQPFCPIDSVHSLWAYHGINMQCFKTFRITDHTILLLGVVTTILGHVGSEITTATPTTTEAARPTQLNNVVDFTTSILSADTSSADQLKYTTQKTLQVALNAANLKTEIPPEKKELSGRRTTSTVTPHTSSVNTLYRLESSSGGACILLRVDALLSFKYTTTLGERIERAVFVPDRVDISGDCSKPDDAKLVMKWNTGFELSWFFSKTLGGERWYVVHIKLRYDTADKHFEHIKHPEKLVLTTSHTHGTLMFNTPVGESLTCEGEVTIKLTNSATDTEATLFLRDFKIQPFIFKNEFGPEYPCSAVGTGAYKDETVPLIVGSTLAAACLCTITGYSIFRYFKIKKVQYDTME